MMNTVKYANFVSDVLNNCFRLLGVKEAKESYNTSDHKETGSSRGTTRPDYILWLSIASMYKGEDKCSNNATLENAVDDLKRKIGTLHPLFYFDIPFIFGHAACDNMFSLYVIRCMDGQAYKVQTFDLNSMYDRIYLVSCMINISRILYHYNTHLEKQELKFLFRLQNWESLSTQQDVNMYFDNVNNCVMKRISNFSSYRHSNKEILTSLYKFTTTANCKNMIQVTNFTFSKSKNSLTITMEPFCLPHNVKTSLELLNSCIDICSALVSLHQYGFVHRDVRWSNILFNNESFLLVDLESSGRKNIRIFDYSKNPEEIFGDIRKFNQHLPNEFQNDSIYTEYVDIYMLIHRVIADILKIDTQNKNRLMTKLISFDGDSIIKSEHYRKVHDALYAITTEFNTLDSIQNKNLTASSLLTRFKNFW
jgi:tRNA A-37 threonylcarbamoyl transferase component Bud32